MQRRKPRKTSWALVLMVLAFCTLVAYGVSVLSVRVLNRSSFGNYRQVNIANIQDLQVVSDGFIYYDGSTVSSLTSAGSVRWSYMLGAEAGFEATDYGVAAWRGNTVTLIEAATGKAFYNGTMDDNVFGAHVGEKYTAVLIGEENNGTVILMDNSGRMVNRIYLEDVTALDYGFFSNGTLLWVMVCDTNGTVPTCCIQTYKPGREIVGSITDTQQLMYTVLFQSSKVLVAGNQYLKAFDYTGAEDVTQRKLIYGWYLADWEGTTDPLMVFVTESQYNDGKVRDVRLLTSMTDRVIRMPYDSLGVYAMNGTVYGFSADGHLMIVPAGSQKANAYRTNLPVDTVYGVTTDGVAVIGYAGTIYLLNLV